MSLYTDRAKVDYDIHQGEELLAREQKEEEDRQLVIKEVTEFFEIQLHIELKDETIDSIEQNGTGCFVTLKDDYNEMEFRFETSKSGTPGLRFVALNGHYAYSQFSSEEIVKRIGDIWRCIQTLCDVDGNPISDYLADEPYVDAQKEEKEAPFNSDAYAEANKQ